MYALQFGARLQFTTGSTGRGGFSAFWGKGAPYGCLEQVENAPLRGPPGVYSPDKVPGGCWDALQKDRVPNGAAALHQNWVCCCAVIRFVALILVW